MLARRRAERDASEVQTRSLICPSDLSPRRSPRRLPASPQRHLLFGREDGFAVAQLPPGGERTLLPHQGGRPAPLPRSTCRRSGSRSCAAECSSCRRARSRGRTGSPPRSSGCSRSWGGWRRSGAGTRSRSCRSGCWGGRRRLQRETRVRTGRPGAASALLPATPRRSEMRACWGGSAARSRVPPLLLERLYRA